MFEGLIITTGTQPKNATDLLKVVNFTGSLQLVIDFIKLQQVRKIRFVVICRRADVTSGLRWCSGQTTRLSPLRFRVRSPVRFILMWTRTQSSDKKSIVNALPKVRGFCPGSPVSCHRES